MGNGRPRFAVLALGGALLVASGQAWASGTASTWTAETAPALSPTFNRLDAVSDRSGAVFAVGAAGSRTLILERGTSGWTRQSSPSPKGSDELLAVKATSRSNAWAVGDHDNGNGLAVLIEHYNGTKWSVQSAPHSGFSSCGSAACSYELQGVAALSASSAWAVGTHACRAIECHSLTLVEHWNGRSWKVQSSPNVGDLSELTGVAAWNNSHVWASGTDGATTGVGTGFIERWNGSSWRLVKTPSPGIASELDGISAVSATNVWAVGDYKPTSTGSERTLVLHWNGTRWRRVSSPNRGAGAFNELHAVSAVSATNVWAVGTYESKSRVGRTLIEHYNGTSWQTWKSPNGGVFNNNLEAVAARSVNSAFAVGYDAGDADEDSTTPLILRCC